MIDMSLQNMLSMRVQDSVETRVALEITGRKLYEHMRVKNDSLKVLLESEKRLALKSPTI